MVNGRLCGRPIHKLNSSDLRASAHMVKLERCTALFAPFLQRHYLPFFDGTPHRAVYVCSCVVSSSHVAFCSFSVRNTKVSLLVQLSKQLATSVPYLISCTSSSQPVVHYAALRSSSRAPRSCSSISPAETAFPDTSKLCTSHSAGTLSMSAAGTPSSTTW